MSPARPSRAALFDPLPGVNEHPVVIGGPSETADSLARDFLGAAHLMASTWHASRARGSELPLALPLLQAYRHAIELLLKAGCLRIQELRVQTEALGRPSSWGRSANLPDILGKTHGIADLVTLLNELMSGLDVDERSSQLPPEVVQTLQFLHDADERGLAFRYGTQKVPGEKGRWEPVRPAPVEIYLDSAITRLENAADLLLNGLGGYLDAYEEIIRDLWHEYQQELQRWC